MAYCRTKLMKIVEEFYEELYSSSFTIIPVNTIMNYVEFFSKVMTNILTKTSGKKKHEHAEF